MLIAVLLVTCFLLHTSLGVIVTTSGDPNFPKDYSKKLISTAQLVYPRVAAYFNNPNAPTAINLRYDGNCDTVPSVPNFGSEILFCTKYMSPRPLYYDVITHEIAHVIQGYPKSDPFWLIEGIADFARWKFGVQSDPTWFNLEKFDPNSKYTDGYSPAARFLLWLEPRYSGIIKSLDGVLRKGIYDHVQTWKSLVGKSVDDLWNEYARNPSLTPAPSGDYIVFYEDKYHQGTVNYQSLTGKCSNGLLNFNDRASSVDGKGHCFRIFEGRDCTYSSYIISGDSRNECPAHYDLASCGMDKKASSFSNCDTPLDKNYILFYENKYHKGAVSYQILTDQCSNGLLYFNDRASSVDGKGHCFRIYEGRDCTLGSKIISGDSRNECPGHFDLASCGMDKKASSFKKC
uniref:Uncharacterized protein n=1 Tax=Panagrolaimus davidi TaxID=227884 RepID=A0A914QZA2_9BILA